MRQVAESARRSAFEHYRDTQQLIDRPALHMMNYFKSDIVFCCSFDGFFWTNVLSDFVSAGMRRLK